ncbi:MAG TPA: hypothetical protein VF469_24815 [Kofleriaceae bacterium]
MQRSRAVARGAGEPWRAFSPAAAPPRPPPHREIDPAHGWSYVLAATGIAAALGWGWTARRPDGFGLSVATAATAAALVAGAIVREAPRLLLIERARATAAGAGGLPVFVVTLAIGAAAIAWIVCTVRGAAT